MHIFLNQIKSSGSLKFKSYAALQVIFKQVVVTVQFSTKSSTDLIYTSKLLLLLIFLICY